MAQYSSTGKFSLTANSDYLYVRNDVADDFLRKNRHLASSRSYKGGFTRVSFDAREHEFVNDCPIFAEMLSHGRVTETYGVFETKNGGYEFGETDRENIIAAVRERDHPRSRTSVSVNPAVGEAYAIVATRVTRETIMPYHIGLVVAKDGSTNVTLEANIGDEGLETPEFSFYDTRIPEASFHNEWEHEFSGAVTIALKARKGLAGMY